MAAPGGRDGEPDAAVRRLRLPVASRVLRELRPRSAHRRQRRPGGVQGDAAGRRAMLKSAPFAGPHEPPDDEYPLRLTTGRSVYHFHTRTKTGRRPELVAAAPEVWVELAAEDAAERGIDEGDVVEVASRAGDWWRRCGWTHPAGHGLRAVPLRVLGCASRRRGTPSDRGERADRSPSGTRSRSSPCSSRPPSRCGRWRRRVMKLPVYLALLTESESTLARSFRAGGRRARRRAGRALPLPHARRQCETHRERLDR